MLWAVVELIVGIAMTGIGAIWLFFFGIMSVFATDKPGGNPGLLAGAFALAAVGFIPLGFGLWFLIPAASAVWAMI